MSNAKLAKCGICKGPNGRFRWPYKPDRVTEWLRIFKKKELLENEKKGQRICARHFAQSDMYYGKTGKLHLSKKANPLELKSHRNLDDSLEPSENNLKSLNASQDNSEPSQSDPLRIEKPGFANLRYLSQGFIMKHMQSTITETSDVSIVCKDGTLLAHRLILASLSPMMLKVLRDNFDELEETSCIIMPDISADQMKTYLHHVYQGQTLSMMAIPEIHHLFACKNEKLYEDNGGENSHLEAAFKTELDSDEEIAQYDPYDEDELDFIKKEDEPMPKLNLELPSYIDHTSSEDRLDIDKAGVPPELQPMIKLKEPPEPEYDDYSDPEDPEKKYIAIDKDGNEVKKRKIGKAWKYFKTDPLNGFIHVCKICGESVERYRNSQGGHVSIPLFKHLRKSHNLFMEKLKKSTSKYEECEFFTKDPNNPINCICNFCQKSLSRHNIHKHMRDLHTQETIGVYGKRQTYPCSYCNKEFKKPFLLREHIRLHTNDYKFFCSFCGKGFFTKINLQNHTATHHNDGEKEFTCQKCGNLYATENLLKTHLYQCTGKVIDKDQLVNEDGTFGCTDCGKSFSDLFKLRIHLANSPICALQDKHYGCEECGHKFTQKTALEKHMRTHTGETPFQCDKCAKKFKFLHKLKNHINNHCSN